MYEMWQMNRLWLTQIYLYRWYIPDLIRLANDRDQGSVAEWLERWI